MDKVRKLANLKTANEMITKHIRSINTNTKLQAAKSEVSTEPLNEVHVNMIFFLLFHEIKC